MSRKPNKKDPLRPAPSDGQEPPTFVRPQLGRQLFVWLIVIGGLLVALLLFRRASSPTEKEVDLLRFEKYLHAKQVEKLIIKGNRVTAVLLPGAAGYDRIRLTLPDNYVATRIDDWKQYLPQEGTDALKVVEGSDVLTLIAINAVPAVLLVLLMLYFFNRQMRLASARDIGFPFLKSNARLAHKERSGVTFEDVAGVDEAKEELQETVEFLKSPEKFKTLGGRIPRGILLVGYPGTGKTLLAKAIAGEAGVPFYSLCGSDFVELFVGVGAARVRDLFQKARENQPCIIFLDEIDAVGRRRGTGIGGGHDEREQTLNAILSEMDGFSRDEGIIVMAATNRPDVLDPALLRPGRFDREIVVDLPDLNGRKAILKVHTRKVKMSSEVDLAVLARGTPSFSGADLEALVNEAAILASRRGKKKISMEELEEARDKVRFGRQKKSRVMSDEDRKMTAYHEAGHALVATLHPDVEPLHKVTIIPRGLALGMTMILPEKDKYGLRKRECIGVLTMQMAGRVAEELFCHDISSGAKDDIEAATKLARKMVTQWGMSEKLGPVSYSDEEEHIFLGSEITRAKKHGEQVSQLIDEEIQTLLQQAYQSAKQMCQDHTRELAAVADALLKIETLTAEEVNRILAGETSESLLATKAADEQIKRLREKGEEFPGGHAAGDSPSPVVSPA